MARGDRRCADVIETAYRLGCMYDAWTETFHYDLWKQAFHLTGIDPDFYTLRERDVNEILPWDFINIGVNKNFLKKEWENAKNGVVTPNCRQRCSGCGVRSYGGGVCFESAN